MADELLGTVEQAMESTPPPSSEPVQAEEQTESLEPTGTSLDKPVQDAELEKLRKQLLGDYTRKTQEIAPLRRLMQEQGITLDRIQTALQLEAALRENPTEVLRLLQAMTSVASEQSQQAPSQPYQAQPQTSQGQDPLAALMETYGEELANPIKQIYEVAKQAHQTAVQLQQQLQKEREERERETFAKAVERAESELAAWLQKNPHFGLTADQLRPEVSRMVGREGILAGVTAKDFEAAALRVLGPEKYREIVYAQQLKAAREKVEKTAPGPVVNPGTPTSASVPKAPGFENPRGMFEGALEYFEALRRQHGG